MPKKGGAIAAANHHMATLGITPVSRMKGAGVPPAAGPLPSPPPATGGNPMAAFGAMAASMDPLSAAILFVNTNPYIIGIFMLLLNLGGRFLSLELTKKQEAFLQAPWIRPVIFFTVIFIATRNVVAAFWVTLLFFFVIWVAANENSPLCMIPTWCGSPEQQTKAKEVYEANVDAVKSFFA
jgi:hypothetical protein